MSDDVAAGFNRRLRRLELLSVVKTTAIFFLLYIVGVRTAVLGDMGEAIKVLLQSEKVRLEEVRGIVDKLDRVAPEDVLKNQQKSFQDMTKAVQKLSEKIDKASDQQSDWVYRLRDQNPEIDIPVFLE